jgi:hypothetical protein
MVRYTLGAKGSHRQVSGEYTRPKQSTAKKRGPGRCTEKMGHWCTGKNGAPDGALKRNGAPDCPPKKNGALVYQKNGAPDGALKRNGAPDGAPKTNGAPDCPPKKSGLAIGDGPPKPTGPRTVHRKKTGPRNGEWTGY